MAESDLERAFAFHLRAEKLPESVREHRFAPPRMWRFDFAWPDRMIAVEVEGNGSGGHVGRHRSWSGFRRDTEKYNAASKLGWRVMRFTSDQVYDGSAVATVKEALCTS